MPLDTQPFHHATRMSLCRLPLRNHVYEFKKIYLYDMRPKNIVACSQHRIKYNTAAFIVWLVWAMLIFTLDLHRNHPKWRKYDVPIWCNTINNYNNNIYSRELLSIFPPLFLTLVWTSILPNRRVYSDCVLFDPTTGASVEKSYSSIT